MIKSRSPAFLMGLYSSSLYRLRIVVLIFVQIFYSGCAGIQNPPEFVTGDMPNYPEAAKADRTTGWVDVEYLISPQGETSSISVIASSPSGVFDKAALEAVATWRFRVIGIELDQLQMKRISRLVFKLED